MPGGGQAAADAADTREGEVRGLLAAAGEHPRATLHLVALTVTRTSPLPDGIRLHPAAEWLLQG